MKVIGTAIIGVILLHVGLVLFIFFSFNAQVSTDIDVLVQKMGFIQIFGAVTALSSICLWIISLVHALRNSQLSSNEKLLWVGLIVVLTPLGAILYCFIVPKPIPQNA